MSPDRIVVGEVRATEAFELSRAVKCGLRLSLRRRRHNATEALNALGASALSSTAALRCSSKSSASSRSRAGAPLGSIATDQRSKRVLRVGDGIRSRRRWPWSSCSPGALALPSTRGEKPSMSMVIEWHSVDDVQTDDRVWSVGDEVDEVLGGGLVAMGPHRYAWCLGTAEACGTTT
jgi:hypothetical protein